MLLLTLLALLGGLLLALLHTRLAARLAALLLPGVHALLLFTVVSTVTFLLFLL